MSFVGVVIRLYMTISGKILGEECERKGLNRTKIKNKVNDLDTQSNR